MKMKKACELTSLTERAIRLYIKKELISPQLTNGLIDFSPADVQQLKDVATLRQFDFTIEQISSMLRDPSSIAEISRIRCESASASARHENLVRSVLISLQREHFASLHALASQIRLAGGAHLRGPDFGRFDELTDAQRKRETLVALQDLPALERRSRRLRALALAACIVLCLAVASALFLCRTRISGSLSTGPVSIADTRPANTATVLLDATSPLASLVGRDTITVPYKAALAPSPGDTYDKGCQLAIDLTNLDLLRLGVSPLQSFRTRSADMDEEWLRLILRALFLSPEPRGATLYIREYTGLKPLLP